MSEDQSKRVSGSYRLDVPRWVLLGLLQRHHGPYSRESALISYLLDVDAGTVKSIREYARLWDWSKKKVELQLPEIKAEVAAWLDASSSKAPASRGTVTGQLRDSDGTKTADDCTESTNSGTAGGQLRDSRGTHTKQPQPQKKTRTGVPVLVGAKASSARPESLDEVQSLWRDRGYVGGDDDADGFWNYYASNGWRVGKNPMKDWRAAAANWNRNNKQRTNGHAAHQRNHKPATDYERRRAGVGRDEIERNLEAIRRGDIGVAPRAGRSEPDPDLEGRVAV